MSNPKSFSAQGRGLKFETKADIEPYLKQIKDIDGIEEIHLGGNTFGTEPCIALAETLKGVNTLKVADLADIFTGRLISEIPPALQAICDALTPMTSLVELDLSDNAFGGRSAEPMVNFLTNNRSFQILKLNNNGLGVWGGTTVASALLESAKLYRKEGKISNLRVVVCGRNRLENGSAPHWAEAFAAHGTLKEVRLPQNGIQVEGITAIAQGLAKCPNLESLDLQDNTAKENGTRAVAVALAKWPNLRSLNLSDCLLSTRGSYALASALGRGHTPKLETLRLQYGEMNATGINVLAQAISDHLPNLVTLELNGNKANPEDECFTNVRDALECHNHGDALDDLDDMEDSDEEEEEEHPAVAVAEELDAAEAEKGQAAATEDPADELAAILNRVQLG
ncbi:Ran GTPase activator [Cantharellus anzutake]|uniref:Ran GTPase activator n=1 Tax=Cantharellus anzutake TaxID=1750568 RepID=UPI001907A377|nr:Ran GTPase activator [Cantharellus anzutake]KAF8338024.1 Ran GTPase activator [Cantharellus anzutake]